MRKHANLLIIISLVVMVLSLGFNAYFSLPYYSMEALSFQNVDELQISAKYLPSKNGYGVIIANDISHDKSELSGMVHELAKSGYGVFIFDLPSQGQSEGTLPFHYKETTYIAEQFYNALVIFSQISELSVPEIHVIGYGEGARAVLQTASYGYLIPRSITLIGCTLNLSDKLDYDIINFVHDASLPWIDNLNETTGECPINLIFSKLDNVSTEEDNRLLSDFLSRKAEENAAEEETDESETEPTSPEFQNSQASDTANIEDPIKYNSVTTTTVGLVAHTLLMSSASVTKEAVSFIAQNDQNAYNLSTAIQFRPFAVGLYFISLALLIYLINIKLQIKDKYHSEGALELPEMPKKFISRKMFVWLFALPIMMIIPACLYYIPVSLPYKMILRISAYSSYGLVLLFLYIFTDFGKSLNVFKKDKCNNIYGTLLVFVVLITCFSLISLSGMYYIFSFKSRWPWSIALSILFAAVFYIDDKERKAAAFTFKEHAGLLAINYAAFIVAPFVLLIFGLYSNAVSSLFCLGFLIIVLFFGSVLDTIRCPDYLSSLLKGFAFQFIAFAQMAMFLK